MVRHRSSILLVPDVEVLDFCGPFAWLMECPYPETDLRRVPVAR
jgi:hypothetical protein